MSDSSNYEVGYRKPPKDTQFKKGNSGNPKGRPKGTNNLKTDLLEELSERMTVRENGKERRISKQRALVKSQMARALKGNDRAAAKIIELYLKVTGPDEGDGAADTLLTDDERAIMEVFVERLRRQVDLTGSQSSENGLNSTAKDPDHSNGGAT